MTATKREMFRPSFTLPELEELNSFIPASSPLKLKLALYMFKVTVGLNAASYKAAPKTLEITEKLGFSESVAPNASKIYSERLKTKAAIGGKNVLSKEERYNYLGMKAMAGEVLSEAEKEEGRKLELELYQLEMGTFA